MFSFNEKNFGDAVDTRKPLDKVLGTIQKANSLYDELSNSVYALIEEINSIPEIYLKKLYEYLYTFSLLYYSNVKFNKELYRDLYLSLYALYRRSSAYYVDEKYLVKCRTILYTLDMSEFFNDEELKDLQSSIKANKGRNIEQVLMESNWYSFRKEDLSVRKTELSFNSETPGR